MSTKLNEKKGSLSFFKLAILSLFLVFSVSLTASDECGGLFSNSTYSGEVNSSTPYINNSSVKGGLWGSSNDTYYINATEAGTVVIEITSPSDGSVLISYNDSSCPSASNGSVKITKTFTSATDFNLRVYTNNTDSTNYTIKIYYISDDGTPIYSNEYACGIFDSVLTSYDSIESNGNHVQACNTASISYPNGNLSGDIKCNPNGCDGGNSCQRVDPPLNKLDYIVYQSSKLGTNEGIPNNPLTDLEYGDFSGNFNITLEPSHTYGPNDTPVMVLGDINLNGNNNELSLNPGDYFFNSLSFTKNGSKLILPNGGPVRIFIKNDLSANMNNLSFNSSGDQKNLFVYVGGNFDSIGNGGGITMWRAYIYVKGSVTLNNNSNNWKIYGGVTAEGKITINGNNPDFIREGDASDLGYGKCQMCYSDIKVGGMSFGMGSCPGFSIGINKTIEVPIQTSETLQNTSVEEAHKKSIFSFSAFNTNEVHDQDGNKVRDADNSNGGLHVGAMGMDVSLYGSKVTTYNLGDSNGTYGPTSSSNYQELYTYTLFGFDLCKWLESLAYVAHYNDSKGRHYNVVIGKCEKCASGGSTDYQTGPFDAWDDYKSTRGINDRNISTKIVNQDFNLTIASINSANNAVETKDGVDTYFRLYDNDLSSYLGGGWSDFNASSQATHTFTFTFTDTPATALTLARKVHRNVNMFFKTCADYDGAKYLLYPTSKCSSDCTSNDQTTNSSPCFRYFKNSDAFAIRPYGFRAFSANQYKRAGEDFNVTIKATDKTYYDDNTSGANLSSVKSVNGYNASLSTLNIASNFYTPSSSELSQMQSDTGETDVATCLNAGIFSVTNPASLFTNGEVNASLKFSETGVLDLNISEKPGHEWAKVDMDDTNNLQRYIKPSTITFDESDISKKVLMLFVPYKFETTSQYSTTTGQNRIYINDINGSNSTFTTPNMAAFIKYTIVAKNKDGLVTKNFTKTCFPDVSETNCPKVNGLKLNTTFDLFLDADLNSTKAVNISLYSEDNSSNPIYTPNKNLSLIKGDNHIKEWISPFKFENGIGEAKVYFNIDRNISKAINPVNIIVKDANTSTSWMTNPGSPKKFISLSGSSSKSFLYGRVHSPDYSVKGNKIDVKIYYEVYCKDCSKTYLNSLNLGGESVDSVYWYINKNHNNINNGKIYNFINTSKIDPITPSTTIANGVETDTLKYNGGVYPYKESIDINASSWLIFNPYDANATTNDFSVEFLGDGGWAGIGTTGKTVDVNMSSKGSKRIEW